MKPTYVSSRYFISFANNQRYILKEKTKIWFKSSFILQGWVDIYLDEIYVGTIPESVFKENFKTDSLILTF